MTGTALLTLIDDSSRHMSLDDFAADDRYLPELKFVCPVFNQKCDRGSQHLGIKLRHLVSHTSGLADVMEQTNAHVSVWLSDLKKSWVLFNPGDFSAYSGVAGVRSCQSFNRSQHCFLPQPVARPDRRLLQLSRAQGAKRQLD